MLHRVEDGVHHGGRHRTRADRDVAAGQRLRDGHEVGLEPPVLEREHAARPTQARLHLVDAEQCPVAAAQSLRALQVARLRQVHALALHRLGEEDGDVLALQLRLQRLEVVLRHAGESEQQRLERIAELGRTAGRERADREPVERVLQGDDPGAAGRRASHLQRGLDGFGARAREQHPLQPAGQPCEQRLGKLARERRYAELHRAGRLALQRLHERGPHPGVVAADGEHPEAAEQVEEAVPLVVDQLRVGRADPAPVETDRAQHAYKLRVDGPRVARERVVLARHAWARRRSMSSPCRRRTVRSPARAGIRGIQRFTTR